MTDRHQLKYTIMQRNLHAQGPLIACMLSVGPVTTALSSFWITNARTGLHENGLHTMAVSRESKCSIARLPSLLLMKICADINSRMETGGRHAQQQRLSRW